MCTQNVRDVIPPTMTIVVYNNLPKYYRTQVWFENSNMSRGREPKKHGCQQPKIWPSLHAKEVANNTRQLIHTR